MKTVGELVHSLTFEEVWDAMAAHYEKHATEANKEGYREVWGKLLVMQPKITSMSVLLTKQKDNDGAPWVDVSGVKEGKNTRYGIEFNRWEEWLSMPVTGAKMTEAEQLAHCLWEMTFCGFDQETVQNTIDEIHDAMEEFGIKDEGFPTKSKPTLQ